MTYYQLYTDLKNKKDKLKSEQHKHKLLLNGLIVVVFILLYVSINILPSFTFMLFVSLYATYNVYKMYKTKKQNYLDHNVIFNKFSNVYYSKIMNEILHDIKEEYVSEEEKRKKQEQKYNTYDYFNKNHRTYGSYNPYDDYERAYRKYKEYEEYEYSYNKQQNNSSTKKAIGNHTDDAYKLLKLSKSDDNTKIKQTFRQLAIKWHPDKFANDTKENQVIANRNMQKLNKAYDLIKKDKGIK